ncbi:hypothetical protein DKM44_01915 [Deinococcus irradiatisoli]|uniref:FAD-binding PCMH-type domain-containing protein n=1 Tax=Deinococcus irradiatisoli TaxID=2202254 RepID=A0A2Z3JJP1_9DEIO|nr:DUF5639 domain-containing protein [Deinococcus irradiatisoli]AWN22148.1 hypothetical protein DKM44_01915 [Deinococcus irradiatisoli]
MPILELSAADQTLIASGDTALLDIYAALPPGLYPPFPPVELPGGLSGLLQRGGFAQNFFFAGEILGVTFQAPSGRLVRAGGRVVKNVQGYDLTRLFVGSFGQLGEAVTVTLRLRPGVAARQVARPGSLGAGLGHRARFIWEAQGKLHLMHFGHAREVEAALAKFGGEEVSAPADYRPLFPDGIGPGEGGPLRDLRFGWANGAAPPVAPALFSKVAAAL